MIPNLIRLIYSLMYLNFSLAAHKRTAKTRFSVALPYYLFIYLFKYLVLLVRKM